MKAVHINDENFYNDYEQQLEGRLDLVESKIQIASTGLSDK
jgi:hypothetical protein